MIEKPFGHDLESAQELNRIVNDVFPPSAVFRIDHYLGKETVQNILALRFANQLWEPVWNANYVDSVQITMAEDIGIGGRGGYYDGIGAARDVIQNHLLQLLALVAMEEPVSFDARSLRLEKEKVLSAVVLPDDSGIDVAASTPPGGRAAIPCAVTSRKRASRGFPYRDLRRHHAARGHPPMGGRAVLPARRQASGPAGGEIAVLFRRAPHLPFEATDTKELGHNARHPGPTGRGSGSVRLEGAGVGDGGP